MFWNHFRGNHNLCIVTIVHVQPGLLDLLHLEGHDDVVHPEAGLPDQVVAVDGLVKDADLQLLRSFRLDVEDSGEVPARIEAFPDRCRPD